MRSGSGASRVRPVDEDHRDADVIETGHVGYPGDTHCAQQWSQAFLRFERRAIPVRPIAVTLFDALCARSVPS